MDARCPSCGVELPAGHGERCPACALVLGRSESETQRLEAGSPPPSGDAQVRLFGAPPPGFGLALALIALVVGASLLLTGRLISGLTFAAVAVALVAVFAAEARQLVVRSGLPWLAAALVAEGRAGLVHLGRAAVVLGADLRARAALMRVSSSAWSRAAVGLVRCRRARRRLQHAHGELIKTLGEATYRGEDDLAATLNVEAHTIAALIAETKRIRDLTIRQARERIARHQAVTHKRHAPLRVR